MTDTGRRAEYDSGLVRLCVLRQHGMDETIREAIQALPRNQYEHTVSAFCLTLSGINCGHRKQCSTDQESDSE